MSALGPEAETQTKTLPTNKETGEGYDKRLIYEEIKPSNGTAELPNAF